MNKDKQFSRRKFLRWGLAGVGALGGLALLRSQGVFSGVLSGEGTGVLSGDGSGVFSGEGDGVFSYGDRIIPGKIVGANAEIGHLLREGLKTPVSKTLDYDVVIVGGGIAGLSAAWELKRKGINHFIVLELDDQPGGNSASGESSANGESGGGDESFADGESSGSGKSFANGESSGSDESFANGESSGSGKSSSDVTGKFSARHGSKDFRYPWGAHYLPLPNLDNRDLLELLEEFGALYDYVGGLPVYEELYLCHAPQERLLIHGLWQEGLVPKVGVAEEDRNELGRFFDFVESLKDRLGSDGKPLFTIPLDASSSDPKWLALDNTSFSTWLSTHGYSSQYLLWYLNYCCRDDFGSTLETTSAWAGLHYFASRNGLASNAPSNSVLTWPEGNGWLVKRFSIALNGKIKTGSLVFSILDQEEGVLVRSIDTKSHLATEFRAKKVIFAGPQFLRKYLMAGESGKDFSSFSYGPWIVANVHLSKRPGGKGRPLSWDNVAYDTDSLGYIVADHQSLGQRAETVVTWYKALTDLEPEEERKAALARSYPEWQELVVKDLEWMHPEIRADIKRLDVWVWGHGMIRPGPGFITSEARKLAAEPVGGVHFAHSDLSGISIFEEAFAQGLRAAREILEGGLS